MAVWTITDDKIDDGKSVGVSGPHWLKASDKNIARIKETGERFRLLDDDGIVYYEGRTVLHDSDSGFEPLDEFGTPNAGCTSIQYFEREEWRTL